MKHSQHRRQSLRGFVTKVATRIRTHSHRETRHQYILWKTGRVAGFRLTRVPRRGALSASGLSKATAVSLLADKCAVPDDRAPQDARPEYDAMLFRFLEAGDAYLSDPRRGERSASHDDGRWRYCTRNQPELFLTSRKKGRPSTASERCIRDTAPFLRARLSAIPNQWPELGDRMGREIHGVQRAY